MSTTPASDTVRGERHLDGDIANEETALLGAQSPGGASSITQVERESWNEPRINTFRFAACNLTFLILGMHDACLGVGLIPQSLIS